MKYTIYQITNTINQKIYIGKHQTKNLDDGYMGSGKHLKRAIKKYGIENFVKEILYVFDSEEEMNYKEAELVTEEFSLREDTYNICIGGKGGFSYINRMSLNMYGSNGSSGHGVENLSVGREARKTKLAESQEYRDLISIIISDSLYKYYKNNAGNFTGKIHKKESKIKISESLKGKGIGSNNSQYGSFWITNGIENKKVKGLYQLPEGWYKGRITNKLV
jgi:hypothetical protein